MEKSHKVVLTLSILIVLVVVFYLFSGWFTSSTGYSVNQAEKDNVAQCLTSKGVKFYSSGDCILCNEQEKLFGSSFKFIREIDCDTNVVECADLREQPAWRINNNTYYDVRSLEDLKKLSGC